MDTSSPSRGDAGAVYAGVLQSACPGLRAHQSREKRGRSRHRRLCATRLNATLWRIASELEGEPEGPASTAHPEDVLLKPEPAQVGPSPLAEDVRVVDSERVVERLRR